MPIKKTDVDDWLKREDGHWITKNHLHIFIWEKHA
jgi:hypothetical protein